jgi:hypothetical protein
MEICVTEHTEVNEDVCLGVGLRPRSVLLLPELCQRASSNEELAAGARFEDKHSKDCGEAKTPSRAAGVSEGPDVILKRHVPYAAAP